MCLKHDIVTNDRFVRDSMKRKLFCQISPLTYKISTLKCITTRRIRDAVSKEKFATTRGNDFLPVLIYRHNSFIRRTLGTVNMDLQDNKAVNLSLAAPKITRIVIYPGETFSFWHLVHNPSESRGYKEGLTIANGAVSQGIGGGMCQFTNLIHWMILHTPLEIVEHHHHNGIDLFPDHNRQIPFGTGTSILYNYLDYRVKNNTDTAYQLITYTTGTYLCGELRADKAQTKKYHIVSENERFVKENGIVYRTGTVWREVIDCKTGNHLGKELIAENHAKVLYDTADLCAEPSGPVMTSN